MSQPHEEAPRRITPRGLFHIERHGVVARFAIHVARVQPADGGVVLLSEQVVAVGATLVGIAALAQDAGTGTDSPLVQIARQAVVTAEAQQAAWRCVFRRMDDQRT